MQNWEGNLYLIENWLSRNEIWCAADINNNMCHIGAKEFLDSNFKLIKQLLTKYQIFTKFPRISHIHKNGYF